MLSFDDFQKNAARVPNHGTERHAHMLYGLIRWLRPLSVVEVGADKGGTTVWIARALQENMAQAAGNPVFVIIDDYSLFKDSYPMLWHNAGLCDVGEMLSIAQANSRDESVWPERVDFAFIDGDHSLDGCKADVEQAIKRGAVCIALHDTSDWWGPRRYMDEHMPEGWTEISCGFDGGFTVMMKRPEKPEIVFTQERFPEGHI